MRIVLLFIAMALSACATLVVPRADEAARKHVVDAANAWVAAYNSRDAARIARVYDSDAVLWGTTSQAIRATPAEILDYFKDAAKRPDARVAIDNFHVRIAGDMAFMAGSYTFSNVVDGKTVPSPSRFTFVFRQRDGQWRLVHHHSSRVAPPRQ
jgi:uncharacterized protein (TIGR02246 family)